MTPLVQFSLRQNIIVKYQLQVTLNLVIAARIIYIFTNSIDLRLESKDIYKSSEEIINLVPKGKSNTPIILKFSYSPQLLMTLNKLSLNVHLVQDLIRLHSIFNKNNQNYTAMAQMLPCQHSRAFESF
jgi:hypothetical protein